jgi:hypothetical protein
MYRDSVETYTFNNNDFKEIKKRIKEKGWMEKSENKRLLALNEIIDDYITRGVDFICMDTIAALLPSYYKHMDYIDMKIMTSSARQNRISFVLLHHDNGKGEPAGSSDITRNIDAVYKLSKKSNDILLLKIEKTRHSRENTFEIKRAIKDDNVKHEIISVDSSDEFVPEKDSDKGTIRNRILDVLKEEGRINFEYLCQTLSKDGFANSSSIKNILKQMEDAGLVRKGDGKHWDTIEFVGSV